MVTKGGCAGWFEQRTNLEKTLISVSCLLLLTLVLLILVGIAFKGNSSSDYDGDEKPGCWSLECLKTTGHIVSLMDERWDPCTNFYDYACGSFSQSLGHSIAQNSIDSVYFTVKELFESSSSTSTEELDSLKSFYGNCMNFEGLHGKREDTSKIFLELMERYGVGSWPVVDDHYEPMLADDYSEVLSALAILGIPVAFKVEVVPDNQIDGSYLLKISPGGPIESGRSPEEIRGDKDLKTYMLFSFLLLGSSTYAKSIRAVDDILGIDSYFATIQQDTKSADGKCAPVEVFAPDESLEKLNIILEEMKWNILFKQIQEEAGINRPFAVEVHCKNKIRDNLRHLLDQVEVMAQNYFGWCFFQSFAKHVEPTLRRTHPGSKDDNPRWKECVMLIEKHAAPLLAEGLSSQRFNKETEAKVQELTAGFRSRAEALVSQGRRLQQGQKAKILRQVRSLAFRTPFARKNATRRVTLPTVNEDNYTLSVIELRKQSVIRNFKKLNPSVEEYKHSESWDSMLTSSAHIPTGSSLPVYFDKIQEPYLRLQGPKGLNYGSFGTFLAREWSESLVSENVGVSANDHTPIWDLWTNDASGCVMNLFSERFGFSSEEEREKHIEDLFLDIGSLEIALETARSGIKSRKTDLLPGFERNDDQMFFIAYAQTQCEAKRPETESSHIPIRERINTIVSNSEAFAEAFSCSSSSSSKCHIWT